MANILFVAYHFAPESSSGTHRGLHFARALMDAGHGVSVIAGPEPPVARSDPSLNQVFPWPDRVRRVGPRATVGTLYVRWNRRRRPRAQGVASADPAPSAGSKGALSRVLARLRYHLRIWEALPDHQRAWSGPALRAGLSVGRGIRADAVFASGPPWTGVMVGHRIAKVLGVPFIADFRDPWTDGSGATWCYGTEWAQRRVGRWEAAVLADAALVCFNSPRLAAVAEARSQLGTRCHVILNGSDVPRRTAPTTFPRSQPLGFRHFGSLYAGRSIGPLLQALNHLVREGTVRPDEVEVELVGDSDPPLSRHPDLANALVPVRALPHVTFAEAVSRMSEPGVLVSVQSEQHANLIPTKLFDYLCTGNPVLVLSPHASASWDVASPFGRCYRFDLTPTEWNRRVLAEIIATWRCGALQQVPAAEDTQALAKPRIGAEFAGLVADLVTGRQGG